MLTKEIEEEKLYILLLRILFASVQHRFVLFKNIYTLKCG